MVKAAEDLKRQQLEKEQQRQKVLAERTIPLPNVDSIDDKGQFTLFFSCYSLWPLVVKFLAVVWQTSISSRVRCQKVQLDKQQVVSRCNQKSNNKFMLWLVIYWYILYIPLKYHISVENIRRKLDWRCRFGTIVAATDIVVSVVWFEPADVSISFNVDCQVFFVGILPH